MTKQDYQTPIDFFNAVQTRFGKIAVDLAVHSLNHMVPRWLGRGGESEDSLKVNWSELARNEYLWLNCEFTNCGLWAEKCLFEFNRGAKIILLTPASIGSEWFLNSIEGYALVVPIRPRLTFVGCKDPFPKDLMLSVYGETPGFKSWRWK